VNLATREAGVVSNRDQSGSASAFRCPKCPGDAPLSWNEAGFFCDNSPPHKFSRLGGVIDFVQDEAHTQLDVTTYDLQKHVNFDASRALFGHIKTLSNGAIRDDIGTVLEIGAGTGMLSLGMLKDSEFNAAIITDVSREMLNLNRARMIQEVSHGNKVTYATYAGSNIFHPDSFDLCIGNSVLHHVENYQQMLRDLRAALRPGGTAIFIEPTKDFHDAMARSISDALIQLLACDEIAISDCKMLAAWAYDVRLRISSAEDANIINALEDKYLFSREILARDADEAGFGGVETIPNYVDEHGVNGFIGYAGELAIADETLARILPVYRKYARHNFREIAVKDQTGMYVCIFTK
jgi:2-polyprenyl-3-methyl-5-hydroxy-6-metoxy-1,4-benzoquinol methylase